MSVLGSECLKRTSGITCCSQCISYAGIAVPKRINEFLKRVILCLEFCNFFADDTGQGRITSDLLLKGGKLFQNFCIFLI